MKVIYISVQILIGGEYLIYVFALLGNETVWGETQIIHSPNNQLEKFQSYSAFPAEYGFN